MNVFSKNSIYYNRFLLFSFLFCLNQSLYAQVIKENIEQLKNAPLIKEAMSDDTSGAPKFLVYPTLAFTPETKWEFGLVNLWLFHAKRNYQNRLNEVNTFTFYTQQRQYGIWVDHAIYSDKNDWFFLGRGRFQYFPIKYYGIGTDAPSQYQVVSNANLQIRERVLRKVKENFYIGLEFDHHRIFDVSFDAPSNYDFPLGAGGSANTALGVGLVYDDRKNVLNVRNGMFAELAYLQYSSAFSSQYNFSSLQYDARIFRPGFSKNQVIAIQSNGMLNLGSVPFNQLALMGGESMMRGYYLGRFRDKAMINLQAEYRFLPLPFSKSLGAAVFASMGNVAPSVQTIDASQTKFAAGLGLRYLVFKAKDIYVRTDLAFTREGSGFYLYIGEAF
ncbi:MAG: BamA/TamA family outer membrane protein [Bacteroidia bacterium]|nr:BamA/TamA family outer membrane protein [Bacteroidia bacterium]